MNQPKVLVACPIHACKEYVIQRWIDKMKSLTYTNYDILLVDNSASKTFMNKYIDQVEIHHVNTNGLQPMGRICKSMNYIANYVLSKDYDWWADFEADTIPEPTDVIEKLLKFSDGFEWVNHAYPVRKNPQYNQLGIGCCIMSRRLLRSYNWQNAFISPDGWIWGKIAKSSEFPRMELWDYFKVEHIDRENESKFNSVNAP